MQRVGSGQVFDQPDVAAKRSAAVAVLRSRLRDPAISCWSSLVHEDPSTTRLVSYNEEFLKICDTTPNALGDGSLKYVVVPSPVFRTSVAHNEAMASRERGLRICIALHSRRASFASSVFVHISKLGRLHYVHAEAVTILKNGVVQELILAESVLPSTYILPSDLQTHYGLMDERYLMMPPPVSPPMQRAEGAMLTLEATVPRTAKYPSDSKPLRWKTYSPDSPPSPKQKQFECASCACHNTAQVRRGPDGKKSLCNRCGLRWKREVQRARATALAVANTRSSSLESAEEEETGRTMSNILHKY